MTIIATVVGVPIQIYSFFAGRSDSAVAGSPAASLAATSERIGDFDASVGVANLTRNEREYKPASIAAPGDKLEIELAGGNLSTSHDLAIHVDVRLVRTGPSTVDVVADFSDKSGRHMTTHALVVSEVGDLPDLSFSPRSRARFSGYDEQGKHVLIPMAVPGGTEMSVDLPLLLHSGYASLFTLTAYLSTAQ